MISQAEASRVLDASAVTSGHRMTLICVAMAKHALTLEGTVADRLKVLEFIDSCVDFNLSIDAIGAVDAASPAFLEIVNTAKKLDPPGREGRLAKSADVLTADNVFVRLLQLNPGLVAALEIKRRQVGRLSRSASNAPVFAGRGRGFEIAQPAK